MPRALQVAIEEDVEFRKGLPRDYLNIMGIANSDVVSSNLNKYNVKPDFLLRHQILCIFM